MVLRVPKFKKVCVTPVASSHMSILCCICFFYLLIKCLGSSEYIVSTIFIYVICITIN
ncbi:hypothetical protein BY996DRAFT_7537146 [Phakopsora pachyrhizi]|nr:hypothetical protein BY996DRAFT_7537146 [Phakopsora pachyrhizi]